MSNKAATFETDEVWGNSGSPFDQRQWFAIGDVARAFIFDKYGKMVPALPTKLTPEGVAYYAWIDTLDEACGNAGSRGMPLYAENDRVDFEDCKVTRADLRKWCESRNLRPRFLFPDTTGGKGAKAADEWRQNAKKIMAAIPEKKEMKPDALAKEIHEEMARRHKAGESGMTKRGGKALPDVGTIKRWVLSSNSK